MEKLLADLYNDDTIDSREIIEIIRGLVPRLTKMLEDSEVGRMFLEERSKFIRKKEMDKLLIDTMTVKPITFGGEFEVLLRSLRSVVYRHYTPNPTSI